MKLGKYPVVHELGECINDCLQAYSRLIEALAMAPHLAVQPSKEDVLAESI